MFEMIREFIRDNRDGIKIGLGIVMIIAGLVLMILSHFLLGLAVLFAGLIGFIRTLSKILVPSDYAGDGTLNGLNGMGRQQSSINKKPTSTVTNEVTSDIWNQMSNDGEEKK